MKKLKLKKQIAISGYFIVLHVGHLDYIRRAAKYGNVVCIVNNDEQQVLKYGKIIVPANERVQIMEAIPEISQVVNSIDTDRTVIKTLEMLNPDYFGNGGDRIKENIPENTICEKLNIKQINGLGDKIQSASSILKKL